MDDLTLIHRLLSIKGNKEYYDIDNVFFIGQKNYLLTKEKDFEFLKHNKHKMQKSNTVEYTKFNYFKSKFYFFRKCVDKFKSVV